MLVAVGLWYPGDKPLFLIMLLIVVRMGVVFMEWIFCILDSIFHRDGLRGCFEKL